MIVAEGFAPERWKTSKITLQWGRNLIVAEGDSRRAQRI